MNTSASTFTVDVGEPPSVRERHDLEAVAVAKLPPVGCARDGWVLCAVHRAGPGATRGGPCGLCGGAVGDGRIVARWRDAARSRLLCTVCAPRSPGATA